MTIAQDSTTQTRSSIRTVLEIALVFVVFFLHGAWPTPDVNETNYVIKALHFWNSDTYAGDFFLGTADAHVGYYWLFGWITQWMSLDAAAWVGRIATWLLLAIAWRGLSFAVVPKAWFAVLSAELFVLLNEQVHMAGEWVIGGVEGKGFAYALVFWSLHALIRGRWNLAWILLGPAVSLHAVVGAWSMVCLGIAWLASRSDRPRLTSMLPGIAIGLLLGAPGLWFGVKLNQGIDFATSMEAARIQVFERLTHHLQPYLFREGYLQRYALLAGLFLLLCTATAATTADRRLRWFIGGGILLALVGFALACWSQYDREHASLLLRFYWFRLADCLTPLGVSLVGLQFVVSLQSTRKVAARWWLAALLAISAYDLVSQVRHVPALSSAPEATVPRADKNVVSKDWRAACEWAAQNTPPGSVFITPRASYTFKWYTRQHNAADSGRGETANWKDMPQDGKRIVEWWGRLNEVFGTGSPNPKERWHESLAETSVDHLQKMAAKYSAQYVIVEINSELPRLPLKPVYENDSYAIYKLEDAPQDSQPSTDRP
jgi:hypothetical protein